MFINHTFINIYHQQIETNNTIHDFLCLITGYNCFILQNLHSSLEAPSFDQFGYIDHLYSNHGLYRFSMNVIDFGHAYGTFGYDSRNLGRRLYHVDCRYFIISRNFFYLCCIWNRAGKTHLYLIYEGHIHIQDDLPKTEMITSIGLFYSCKCMFICLFMSVFVETPSICWNVFHLCLTSKKGRGNMSLVLLSTAYRRLIPLIIS